MMNLIRNFGINPSSAKQSEMSPPDELTQVPPDFPEMVDSFQLPVAYQ